MSVINMCIQDIAVNCLVDTGADVNLCSGNLWKHLAQRFYRLSKRTRNDITLMDFSVAWRSIVQGETCLPFMAGYVSVPHETMVIKGLNQDIILGRDWLTRYKTQVDFKSGTVILEKGGSTVRISIELPKPA